MRKRILVTGSEGYIGSIMVPYFLEHGYDVVRQDNGFYEEGNLDKRSFPDSPIIKKDVRDITKDDLEGFDSIIHLAGLSTDPIGKLHPQLTYDINYHASVRMGELAKAVGVKRFLFSSSCSLYGKGGSDALTEESEQNPQTVYAESKILTEQGLAGLADETFSPVYLRNATAFGFSPRHRFDIVVNNLAGFAHTTKKIVILGDGKPWRPLVHIYDIIKAFHLVLESPTKDIHNQAFNVGSSAANYQIKTLAELVKDVYKDCAIEIKQENAADTRDYHVSFAKIEKVLGFTADWTVPMGVQELYDKYHESNLTPEQFESRLHTRLKQIRYLVEAKKVDDNLRFV